MLDSTRYTTFCSHQNVQRYNKKRWWHQKHFYCINKNMWALTTLGELAATAPQMELVLIFLFLNQSSLIKLYWISFEWQRIVLLHIYLYWQKHFDWPPKKIVFFFLHFFFSNVFCTCIFQCAALSEVLKLSSHCQEYITGKEMPKTRHRILSLKISILSDNYNLK